MAKERKAYAPFSLTSEAGVAQTPVEGYIDVKQQIYPTVSTGTINENGTWAGVKSDDTEFIGLSKAEAIPNGGVAVFPDTNNFNHIDMDGFTSLQVALKVTNGGTYAIEAVFGPDTTRFANLEPISAGTQIKIIDSIGSVDEAIVNDNIGLVTSWIVLTILKDRVKGQRNMQFKIANSSGDTSDIEFGFRRLV
jgi:hypothetical protein